jgi:hypothetical protein
VSTRARGASALAALLALIAYVVPAAHAQGQGQGHGHGHGHGPPPGVGQPGGEGGPPGQRGINAAAGIGPTGNAEFPVRNFGSWVDDAYVLPRGEAWVGIGAGYWRLPFATQVDAPMLSASIGVADRLHLTATVPIANVRYVDGFSTQRVGDAYISGKIGLRDPTRGIGVAVAPLLEVLSDGSWPSADGGTIGRVHWALPVNLEYRGTGWRTYGSAGYFSRGAVFGSGTLDISLGARAGVLGLLSHSYSTRDTLGVSGVDARRSRTDASGGVYVLPRASISLYALAGRTLSQIDDYASRFFLSGGVSFRVAQPASPHPVTVDR